MLYDDWDDETELIAKPPAHGESRAWLVTFTDLVMLILTFFVLLFSMSNVKVDRWEQMIDALSQTLNPAKTQPLLAPTAEFNIGTIFRKRAINLDYLKGVIEKNIAGDPLLGEAQLVRMEDRLVVALPGDLLFRPGRAVMTASARQALFGLGGILRNIGNQIGVNGHSSPVPPEGDAYASNWELSVARAAAVANALRRAGYTDNIVAYGYSDSRYGELADLPEERRKALAHRVDIVVLPTPGGT